MDQRPGSWRPRSAWPSTCGATHASRQNWPLASERNCPADPVVGGGRHPARLLPRLPPRAHGVEWRVTPLRGRIGGDFYDVVEQVPGRLVLLAADVSGRAFRCLALGSLRAAFRTLARDHDRRHAPRLLSDAFHQSGRARLT